MENLVEYEYGLYTEPAKKARANNDAAGTYRHWTLSSGSGAQQNNNGNNMP